MKATSKYRPIAVPIEVIITPFISFSSLISFATVNIYNQKPVTEKKQSKEDREGYILMTSEGEYDYWEI